MSINKKALATLDRMPVPLSHYEDLQKVDAVFGDSKLSELYNQRIAEIRGMLRMYSPRKKKTEVK